VQIRLDGTDEVYHKDTGKLIKTYKLL